VTPKKRVPFPSNLVRTQNWAGLAPGDRIEVEGRGLRGASWTFLAHVRNAVSGEEWVEVVGGKAGDRTVRSFRPHQVFAPSARKGNEPRPSLADAPQLPLY
jgi:hypothetical protein